MKNKVDSLQLAIASSLMTNALQASIIQALIRKGLISHPEGREIYEQALLMLETSQTKSEAQDVFETARGLMEPHLRKMNA